MKIFTPCWGEKHIELLDTCLGMSLRWPKNNKSIENAEWIVLTSDEAEANKTAPIIKRISSSSKITIHPGGRLIDSLVAGIHSCLKDQEPMLMATPDFIYGDGTIDAFKAIAGKPGICASIAHMRVLPSVLPPLRTWKMRPPINCELMEIGFDHPHISWRHSEEGCEKPMSQLGGIRWNDLGCGIKAVRHYLPSPFFCNFIEADLKVFTGTDFVHWDHTWPSNLLMDNRLRYIGSSDAACMIEVTDADMNVPDIGEGDGYARNFFHNKIQGQFVSIFRGI